MRARPEPAYGRDRPHAFQEEPMTTHHLELEPDEDERGTAPTADSLTRYFDEVGRYPLLTRHQEIRLARLAAAGDATAKRRLVESNLRLVVTIARGYQGMGLDLLDLIQEGNLGLMRAVDRYDVSREARFGTYAAWCIRADICRALSTKSRVIRLPVRLAQHESRVNSAEERLAHEHGRRPSSSEVARAAGVDESVVVDLRTASRQVASLDEPAGDADAL